MTKFATPKGTQTFKSRARDEASKTQIHEGHFQEIDGIHLTKMGMGTYLGDLTPQTDQMVENAVVKSVKSGSINIIDTAINYRQQLAERSIGRGLDRLRENGIGKDQIFISSKNGYLPGDADKNYRTDDYIENILLKNEIVNEDKIVDGIHCMHPDFLAHQLDQTLLNLGIDSLDLMYLHNAAESQLSKVGSERFYDRIHKAFEFYEQMRDERKIKYYGLATWECFRVPQFHSDHLSLEKMVEIAREVGGENHGFKFVQLPLNMSMPEALTEQYQEINGKEISFVEAAVALDIGIFTSVPLFQGKLFRYNVPKIKDRTPAQVILEFVRSIPDIVGPVVGHKQPKHVEENIELATKSPLDFETYRQTFFQK